MRILVTGGCGFIGNYVAKQLKDMGHVPIIIDSYTNYNIIDQDVIDGLFVERQIGLKCMEYDADVVDECALEEIFTRENPEVVIHMAAAPRAKVVDNDLSTATLVMTTGLVNVLQEAKKVGVRRFVFISSSMVYGDFDNDFAIESGECRPKGNYAILKYYGELLVKDFCKANGMEYVIIRPSAVYGPMDIDDRVVAKFIKAALNNEPLKVKGEREFLDFTFVTDTANGICLASTMPIAANDTFNITAGQAYNLKTVASMIVNLTKSNSEIVVQNRDPSFPRRGTLLIQNAIANLGYQPKVTLEDGLKQYIEWFKESIFNE